MDFRKLEIKDTNAFCELIKDMYSSLENLEWFSPMPFDYENVKSIIENPRFYVLGAFDGEFLCSVSSFDYKCGKLIGKIDFPSNCNTEKLVEIGFTMVHSNYRGQGIMKKMILLLIEIAKKQGFEWVFGKVHKDNLASSISFKRNNFYKCNDYNKPVKISDIKNLLEQGVLSEQATKKINYTLEHNINDQCIWVDYEILIKNI